MPDITCEIVDDPALFIAIIGNGGEAVRYFHTPAWVDLLWRHFEGQRGSRFVGLLARCKGVLAGWWPLTLSRRSSGFRLQNLGQEISDYAEPHIEPRHRQHANAIFTAMLDAAVSLRQSYAFLQWRQFLPPEGVRLPPQLQAGPRRMNGWISGTPRQNYYIECGPFARNPNTWFAQRLSRNVRKNLRHEHNVLRRLGEVNLVSLNETPALSALRKQYFLWYRHGDPNDPARRSKLELWWSFYESQLGINLDASRLDLNGCPIGLIFGFRRGGEYDLFSLAFDPAYAEYSPGKHHLLLLIQREIANGTIRFNFLAGNEGYKRQLATDAYPTWDLCHTHLGSIASWVPYFKAYVKALRGG